MRINLNQWEPFYLGKILQIKNGKGITQTEIEENPGTFAAVQSGEDKNGVMGYIDYNYCVEKKYTYSTKPCLTVARSGTAGFVSYQDKGCVVGDSAKILLLPDEIAAKHAYLFLQTILNANRYKYSYGRKVKEDLYKQEVLLLPIKRKSDGSPEIDKTCKFSEKGYIPDWQWMETYIMSLHHKKLTTKNEKKTNHHNITDWQDFRVGNLFTEIYKANAYNADDLIECKVNNPNAIAYITRTDENNGCKSYIIQDDTITDIEDGNAITIGDTTSTIFYQNEKFICGDHMVILRAPFLNKYNALFIVTILQLERYRYNYGRAFLKDIIADTEIILPAKTNQDGEIVPDFEYMENYIKSLPYGDRL